MNWVKARMEVPAPVVAEIEALLETLGAVAVSLEDARDQALLEPAPGETPLWRDVVVSGLFAAEPDPRPAVAAAARHWLESGRAALPEIRFEPLEDEDWTAAWRQHAHALSFPGCLHLVPCDDEGPVGAVPDDGGVRVLLAPGLAFGTGGHPTTRGCLAALARRSPRAVDVIDFGCGSGVLALAALVLGAGRVVAIDHDPQALAATRENALRNGVGDRLEVRAELGADDHCTVLLANVLARPLIELAPGLQRRIAPGGRAILSGILPDQAEDVMRAWGDFEFVVHVDDGWVCLDGVRRDGVSSP
ncbi:MAG TPA: 50S ribosomal protein L11 methyltransferase [Pseudomonadales bacterium]|nr:50S ribosomal protein L11 methyltransferase [Pseudomonadales bacterium]